MSEVGYTRRGSDFGKRANFVECIVSGGKGTIPVVFEGKKYYVCCGGCRDYFRDNPEEVLREYHQRSCTRRFGCRKIGIALRCWAKKAKVDNR